MPDAVSEPGSASVLDSVAESVVRELSRTGATVATAESLTGGLVAAALTSVPGASVAVRGGVVAYATDLKASLAGVPADLLDRSGPVSAATASAMASGARRVCDATYGVATTGVAGPNWQDGHPPGTLYVAVAGPRGEVTDAPAGLPHGGPERGRPLRSRPAAPSSCRGGGIDAAVGALTVTRPRHGGFGAQRRYRGSDTAPHDAEGSGRWFSSGV